MKRNLVTCLLVAGLGGAALLAPWTAAAQVLEQRATDPKPEKWQAVAGVRSMLVRSAGYDPFATNDALTQVSLGMERLLLRREGFGFAAGAVTEYGLSSASARSAEGELQAWRLAAVAEGRYQPWHGGYGFLRVAPGVLGMVARLTDSSSPTDSTLEDSFQVFSADISGGAAVRLGPPPNPVSVWFRAEGGYSWAGSHHLMLAPGAAPRDQAKLAPVDLGTINPGGAFFRLSIALAY